MVDAYCCEEGGVALLGKCIGLIIFLLYATSGLAATFFVRSGASGNGTSWANAWAAPGSISWGSVTAGSTICVAGGTYSSGFHIDSSGASGNPITIQRATASDSTCGSGTAGWSAGYDAQVVVNISGASDGINWNNADYVTVTGMVANGIKFNIADDDSTGVAFVQGVVSPRLLYVEISGPGGSTPVTMNFDNRGIDGTAWNGSTYENIDGFYSGYNNIHGFVNLMWLYNFSNAIIEHTRLADAAAENSVTFHANVFAIAGCNNVTFRYNEITNWQVEGIMMIFDSSSNWYIYGNLWHNAMGGTGGVGRILEVQDGVKGPVYLYNNTIVNIAFSVRTANGGSYASGSEGRNNIYWNTSGPGLPSDDYDLANFTLGESHGADNASDPFVSIGSQNYQLSGSTTAGQTLASPYNIDYLGNTRGGDGTWDRGTYEYCSGGCAAAIGTRNGGPITRGGPRTRK